MRPPRTRPLVPVRPVQRRPDSPSVSDIAMRRPRMYPLVLLPGQAWQVGQDLALPDRYCVAPSAVAGGAPSRVGQLVRAGIFLHCDGAWANRPVLRLSHQRHMQPRVQPAREERSAWGIAHPRDERVQPAVCRRSRSCARQAHRERETGAPPACSKLGAGEMRRPLASGLLDVVRTRVGWSDDRSPRVHPPIVRASDCAGFVCPPVSSPGVPPTVVPGTVRIFCDCPLSNSRQPMTGWPHAAPGTTVGCARSPCIVVGTSGPPEAKQAAAGQAASSWVARVRGPAWSSRPVPPAEPSQALEPVPGWPSGPPGTRFRCAPHLAAQRE
jgi:hypothetical protein